jgi:hypothetical protein
MKNDIYGEDKHTLDLQALLKTGANLTIMSYNDSAVKIGNATTM